MNHNAVLVTGGAGFIGSHLGERLLSEGYKVVCLDNFDGLYNPQMKRANIQPCMLNSNFKLVEGDIRDTELLSRIFEENAISKVVHLAAKAGVRTSLIEPQLYEDINVKGTINLLEACKTFEVENVIFGSSSSVYGNSSKVPFSEEDEAVMPISPYAASKRAGELYCYTYSHLYGIPIICFRFFTVYGPRQRPEMAIHKFTRLIDQEKEITMFGDGTSKRDYTYISDIIDGIINALGRQFKFEIFNLGRSETIELRFLIRLIENKLGKTANIRKLPEQPGDVSITFADVNKSKRMLNYCPKVGIEEGIETFVEWYKNENGRSYT